MSAELSEYLKKHRSELICAGEIFKDELREEFGEERGIEELEKIIKELNKDFGI